MSTTLRYAGIVVVVLLLAACGASAATVDVSPPQNITGTSSGGGNGYYERDPELLMASGGTWYLIYSRSQTEFTVGGNPDGLKYDTYYQTSTDNGATWSAAAMVLDAAAISANANLRSATICEADGRVWVIAANTENLEGDIYATTYSGGSWSAQAMIFDGTFSTGAFHVDAVAEGNDIRLFYGIQNETLGVGFIKYHGDTDTWDTAVTLIGASAGFQIPRVIKEGSTYYLVSTDWSQILFASTTTPDVTPWPAASAITTAPTDGASSDPCILKYGASDGTDDLIAFHAPWYPDDSQPQEYVYSTDGGATWSGSNAFTECVHGAAVSWDMMPRAYMKDSNTIISFFGMEDRIFSRGQADIVAVTWSTAVTIGNAHYTTIQDGVDNASTGDVVSVAAGTYTEQVEITQNLTLAGAGEDVTIIEAPDPLTKSFLVGTSARYWPVVMAHGVDDVTVQDLTADGRGLGNAHARFTGIGYFNAGGAIEDCTIRNVKDTPYTATNNSHYSIRVDNRDRLSHSLTITRNTIYEFERFGMYVYSDVYTPLALDVSGNDITGLGPSAVVYGGQVGMQIGYSDGTSITGTVTGNTIAGVCDLAYAAVSIWISRADLDLIGNAITDGQYGIYDIGCSGTISGNTIRLAAPLDTSYVEGIYVNDPPFKMQPISVDPEGTDGLGDGVLLGSALATLDIDIVGNRVTCTGPGVPAPGCAGIDLFAGFWNGGGGYGGNDDLDVNVADNVITQFDCGMYIDWCDDDVDYRCGPGRFVALIARNDSIYDNASYGIFSLCASPAIDARECWWGDASGPYHPTLNPSGTGNQVSDYVLFDPWLGKTAGANIVCDPDPQYLTVATSVNTVDVNYLGGGGGLVYGYSVSFTWDDTKATLNSVTQGDLLSSQGPTWFEVSGTGNTRTVDCVLMGPYPGVTGPGTMFTLTFTGTGQGSSPIDVTVEEVRDNTNAPLTGFIEDDGELIVDVTNPSVTGVFIDNQTLPHTDDWVKNGDYVCVTATVTDAGGIASIYADLSELGGGSSVIPASYEGGVATWCLIVSSTPPSGTRTVRVTATDLVGNVGLGSDAIEADNVAPDPIADLAAAQQKTSNDADGTTKIALTFTAPGDAYAVEVYRAGFGSYPEYDDGGGTAPATPGYGPGLPWELTGVTASGQKDETTARGFWYYVAFVKDIAWNISVVSNQTTGTLNYFLGDVTDGVAPGNGDNKVSTADFSALSASYWKNLVLGDPANYLDVGPTTDYSVNGRPTTDDFLNFEDLMMLALNFTTPTPAPPENTVVRFENPNVSLVVDGVVGNTLRAHLVLSGNRQSVKGMHTAVSYNPATLEFVSATQGSLILNQPSPVFFEDLGGDGKVQVDLAAILSPATIKGSGEVATIEFQVVGSGNTTPTLAAVDMRDKANKPLGRRIEPRLDDTFTSNGVTAPITFGAYPNPFHGSTEIVFSVPAATAVSLKIYDVNGRLVRGLVDGVLSAGSHRVVWDGRASNSSRTAPGVYLAVIRIGGEEQASKMFLLP